MEEMLAFPIFACLWGIDILTLRVLFQNYQKHEALILNTSATKKHGKLQT
jgi:hypothetical protein